MRLAIHDRIEQVFAALVRRTGRSSSPDPALPWQWIAAEGFARARELTRGCLRLRRRCFLGRRVQIRGRQFLTVGRYASVGDETRIDATGTYGIRLAQGSRIGRFSTILATGHMSLMGAGFSLGERSGLGDFAHVGGAGGVYIGNDVIAGAYVSFHSQSHIFTRTDVPIREQGTTEQSIVIGDDVWIGAKVTFLSGAAVGSGSVVAAGSVVRDEFPDRSVIAGVPARIVGTRGA